MRALRSFTVRPSLPTELEPLRELAMNLRWAWDDRTRDLFRWVDPDTWDATRHDPVGVLSSVSAERLAELANDPGFLRFQSSVREDLTRYLADDRWFQHQDSPLRTVAYFSPEFGITEALPQYSGGLGILAGDHLKAASDLGVPLVAVGLFYRHGYFRQRLSQDGWQEERFPDQDPYAMALSLCDGVTVEVPLGPATLTAQVWRAEVGRISLYLLDADVPDNPPELRQVTDRLYGGDVEHRLRQEILLGVGGVQALNAVGVDAQVFHTNEGHAGFLGLERIRQAIASDGLTFDEAVEATRSSSIFTTHTPVPAGIDRFPRDMMETYFGEWATKCGVSMDRLMALGNRPSESSTDPDDERFNMAAMGLRLAGRSNAVSALHGEVSRAMFGELWPDLSPDDVPIGSVTNGVHAASWVSSDMDDLLSRYVLPDWDEAGPQSWDRLWSTPDDELWRVKQQARARLVSFVRDRVKQRAVLRGASLAEAAWADSLLDPDALTIGFARRFATYKRANLLLGQGDRLRDLLLAADRPVQFIFAGKAHPADDDGKTMIAEIVRYAAELGVRHRFVFLDDYDISVARALYQGADVWLNTPRRPQEACGTSGMKAALNATLNCSILDGWWDELFDGTNGWAVASAEHHEDPRERDRLEADNLFDVLEQQVIPLFYEGRGDSGPQAPHGWMQRVKANLVTLGPAVVASRMVRDYVTDLYEPTAAAADALRGDGFAAARDLAAWKHQVREHWSGLHLASIEVDSGTAELGSQRRVQARVSLGKLEVDDVAVQVISGRVTQHDALSETRATPLACTGVEGSTATFSGELSLDVAGRYGLTVRAIPTHPGLANPLELGMITWPDP